MSRENTLVSAQWVEDNLDNDKIVLVEVDEDTTAYDKGHIQGAIKLDWTTDLQDQVRRDFVNKEQFEALLSSKGVANDDTIVLYGGNNNWFAAYAYWVARMYGHTDVALMNGGRKKWEAEGRELTTDAPTVKTTRYQAKDLDLTFRAYQRDVQDYVGATGGKALVDVRSPAEFSGEIVAPPGLPETAQRAGHIPGASNIPWGQTVNDDGTFKSADDLTALYAAKGVTADKDVVAYCRIGERSSHSWFVLSQLLGFKNVRNYDGSWTEWGSIIGAPIDNPAAASS